MYQTLHFDFLIAHYDKSSRSKSLEESAENIIFLLKIIELIFDIKRFVYVLSYDRIRVNNLLKQIKDNNPSRKRYH